MVFITISKYRFAVRPTKTTMYIYCTMVYDITLILLY